MGAEPDVPADEERAWRVLQAVAWVALLSTLCVAFGPAPSPGVGAWPSRSGQLEWRDQAWWLTWLVLPPLVAGAIARWPRLGVGRWVAPVLVVAAVASLASEEAFWGLWAGFGPWDVAAGAGIASVAWGLRPSWGGRAFLTITGMLLLATTIVLLREAPAAVLDAFHLTFTLDEVLAPAAGRWPWVDYSPQYSGLIGAPLAWLTLEDPLAAGLDWLWALTAVVLALLLAAQLAAFGSRGASLHLAVLAALPLIVHNPVHGIPGGYHANYPIRLLGPALAYVALMAWVRAGPVAASAPRWLAGIGVVAAVACLNNLEFGAVATAGLLMVAWLRAGRQVVWCLSGAVLPVLLLAAFYAVRLGQFPDPAASVAFIRLQGGTGIGTVDMAPWGLHTVLAAGLAAMWLGAAPALRRSPHDPASAAWVFLGLFGLGTLGYFAGRSVPAAMLAGAFPSLALGAAGWAARAWREPAFLRVPLGEDRLSRWSGKVLGGLALVVVFTPLASVPRAWAVPRHPASVQLPPAALVAGAPAGTVLLATNGNLLQLRTGLPNSLPFNHPADIVGPAFADCYCEALAQSSATHLLVEPQQEIWGPLNWARKEPSCALLGLDDEAMQALWRNIRAGRWTLLPLNRAGLIPARPMPPRSRAPGGPPPHPRGGPGA